MKRMHVQSTDPDTDVSTRRPIWPRRHTRQRLLRPIDSDATDCADAATAITTSAVSETSPEHLDMMSLRHTRPATELDVSRAPSPSPSKRARIANEFSSYPWGKDDLRVFEGSSHDPELSEKVGQDDVAATTRSKTVVTGKSRTTATISYTTVEARTRPHTKTAAAETPASHPGPFPLMRLPAEIRNEIYRACLTRPFNIYLSKTENMYDHSPFEENVLGGPGALLFGSPNLFQNSTNLLNHTELQQWLNERNRAAGVATSPTATPGSPSSSDTTQDDTNNDTATAHTAGLLVNPPLLTPTSPPFERPLHPRPSPTRRPQDLDPLIVNLLRVSKTVYQEARSILYSENRFTLSLDTALSTLAALHQRSRRQIKFVELEIPCYNEILERFQETVRLSLRYCWGLKTFIIHMPFILPGANGSGTTGNTTVYANGFDILRWLPRQCEVVLKGNVCAEIEAVVSKNANLAKTLDELAYARRQLISNENDRS